MFGIPASRLVNASVIAICLVGIFLRAYFWAVDRSLWLDEAMLALNLVSHSFLGLLKPLDYAQGAPIGFLVAQKVVIGLLGNKDYILRLIPLLAGCASVPLMYVVSRQYNRGLAPLVSLGLFALSPNLIYYSSELKQYSTDVFAALVLLLVAHKSLEDDARPRTLVALAIAGSLAMWISHPVLFVMAAIIITSVLAFAIQRLHRLRWLIGAAGAWGITLTLLYSISLRHLASNGVLVNYWSGSFAPLPVWRHFSWYRTALTGMLHDPAGLPENAISVGLLVLGVFSLGLRRWRSMLVLTVPFLLTLIASALGRYPFSGRLLLFLVPLLLLLLVEGMDRVRTILLRVNRQAAFPVFVTLAACFLYPPAIVALRNVQSPPMREHIKPVMAYLASRKLSTDVVYIYYSASPAFRFYVPLYGFDTTDFVQGISAREEPARYLRDVDQFKGSQRVWFGSQVQQ
jgi:hypothetical protein